MTVELVKRLRTYPCEYCGTDCIEAADLIETQAAEIERLREALAQYAYGNEPFGNEARNALDAKL